jgi:hypothetical protein
LFVWKCNYLESNSHSTTPPICKQLIFILITEQFKNSISTLLIIQAWVANHQKNFICLIYLF